MFAQSGASLGRRDAAGRTAQQVAAAAKQGLAEAAIVAQSEEVARESTLVAQEAMLQELRQLRPVQSHLEVEAAKLEQLQLQAATFASEEGVFGGASALQEACTKAELLIYIEKGSDPNIILKHYWYSTCKHLQECFDKMSRQGGFCGIFGIGNSKNISNLSESQPN